MEAQLGLLDHRLSAVEARQTKHEERAKTQDDIVTELRVEQASLRSSIRTAIGFVVVIVPVVTSIVVAIVNRYLR